MRVVLPIRRRICARALFATESYHEALGLIKSAETEQVIHIEKERVENGEIVGQSGSIGSVLGHDFKERALDPNPDSNRWRAAFLRVGAFKRRSILLEKKKPVFEPDELLACQESQRQQPQLSKSPQPSTIDGIPISEFQTYITERLREMDDEQQTMNEALQTDEGESNGLPIEFGTVPYDAASSDDVMNEFLRVFNWMPSGRRTRLMKRSRSFWWKEWEHMWNVTPSGRCVPSSLRRFYSDRGDGRSRPYRALYYVEDTVTPQTMSIGRVQHLSALVVDFLKTQPSFAPQIHAPKSQRKNTLWPERRERDEAWRFVHRLSKDLRQDRFCFDWEKTSCYETRLYQRPSSKKRKTRKSPPPRSAVVHVFGDNPPIRQRYKKEIGEAKLRLPTYYSDSDSDQPQNDYPSRHY